MPLKIKFAMRGKDIPCRVVGIGGGNTDHVVLRVLPNVLPHAVDDSAADDGILHDEREQVDAGILHRLPYYLFPGKIIRI